MVLMLKRIAIVAVALLIVIQFVPKSVFPTSNPPVDETRTLEATAHKLSPGADGILKRSCYDCHSSKTAWPLYSKVAPVSWLLSHDVKEGRREVNFSDWGTFNEKRINRKLTEICEQVQRSEMPLWYYTPMHPDAKLSDSDRKAICAWTQEERQALAAAK